MRKEFDELKLERQKETLQREAQGFLSDWGVFSEQKNAAGGSKFPDVMTDSETGRKLAADIGSLVGGRTEVSKQFIAKVRERLPNAGTVELFTQAYRFLGGRVDESPAPVSKAATQNHLQRSNRAASSVPGSGASFEPKGNVKLSRRDALARAMRESEQNS